MNKKTAMAFLAAFALLTWGAAARQGAPSPPVNLTASGEYEGAVAVASLKWQDESDDEVGFEVLRSDNNEEFRVIGFVGANTRVYKDKVGRYITGSFAYKVRAFNQKGKSGFSNVASVWF